MGWEGPLVGGPEVLQRAVGLPSPGLAQRALEGALLLCSLVDGASRWAGWGILLI